MADRREMWKALGMDVDTHDGLCAALPVAFGDVYLSQKNRPEGMAFWDFVVSDIHGIRPAELLEAQKEGRKVFGTFCVFVPDEVVVAANGIVTGLCGGSQFWVPDGEKVLPKSTCPLADELEERNRQGISVFEKGTKRIMITGTPMAIPNWKLHHIVETSGAAVVCEEMCTGTRYFENLVEEGLTTLDEQYMALSKRYMKNNCACFTPNPGRVEDILRLAKEYQVDGVIDVNLKFCCLYDTEGYSVERALKEAGIPVLGIETDYDDGDSEQLRTRIGAFVEMLG